MAGQYSRDNIEIIARALPRETGLRPRDIGRSSGVPVAPHGVRAILLQLVREGRAAAEGEAGQRRYRSATGTQTEERS